MHNNHNSQDIFGNKYNLIKISTYFDNFRQIKSVQPNFIGIHEKENC